MTVDAPPVSVKAKRRKGPSEKQLRFAKAYHETTNAITAYTTAGYVTDRDEHPQRWLQLRAYQVLRSEGVQSALRAFREDAERRAADAKAFTRDWIIGEHQRLMVVAEKDGNLAVATDNLIALGKTLGLYSEGITIDLGQLRAYSESEAIEAKRLASIMLEHGDKPATALPQAAQCEHTMPADIPGNARVLPDSDESTAPSPPNGPGVNSRPSPEPTQ